MNFQQFKYNYMPGEGIRVVRPMRGPNGQAVFQYQAAVPLNLLDVGMRQVTDAKSMAPIVTFDTIMDQLVRQGAFQEVPLDQPIPAGVTQVNLLTNDAQELQAHLTDYINRGRHVEFGLYLDHHMSVMLDQPHLYLNRTLPPGLVIASKDPVEGFLPASREDYINSSVQFQVTCMLHGRPEVIATLRPLHIFRYAAGINPTYDPVSRFDSHILSAWLGQFLVGLFAANFIELQVGEVIAKIYTETDRTTQATMRMKIGLEESVLPYKLLACLEPRHLREPVFANIPATRHAPVAMRA